MDSQTALQEYECEFLKKTKFIEFVYDKKLSHFEKPLEKKIPLFSFLCPEFDPNIIDLLDSYARGFNNATTRDEKMKAAQRGLYGTRVLN